MNVMRNTVRSRSPRKSLAGRLVSQSVGVPFHALMELTDDCSIQGRRRRSEIAESVSRGEPLQGIVALAW